jgi:hypothetical protein
MRVVERTVTKVNQPRPPWEWRGEWRTGAPRTLLSNYKDPVYVKRAGRMLRAGRLDWMLRLYQHVGVSERDVLRDGHVIYDPQEWAQVKDVADWLEYVDNRREVVFRISKKEAVMRKQYIVTDDGILTGIPLDAYTPHERD